MGVVNQADLRHARHGEAEKPGNHESERPSPGAVSQLTLDFLRWVASTPRTHTDAMEVWRTSCPRYPIWEDALEDDLVRLETDGGGRMGRARVTLSPRGLARLQEHRTP
jgi:hypothetical protein